MRLVIALLAGGLFGAGLHLSGMTDTARVLGFLDLFGAWDPTLMFVMGGAILPMAGAWALTRRYRPLTGGIFPTRPDPRIDRRLVTGALMFGAGWGMVGLCPGPAIASISYGGWPGAAFAASLVLGMGLAPALGARLDRAKAQG